MPSRPHLALVALAATVTALVALVLPASAAQAATYSYWGYYQLSGDIWSFSQKGADATTPADGAVEGWRWAVSDGVTERLPRDVLSFAEICDTTAAQAGMKRVGVVLDYGRAADGDGATTPPSPVARCASVATAATGAEVLAAVADVRTDKGLVCGIDDYPASGCGAEIATVTAAQAAADTPVTISPVGVSSSAAPSPDSTIGQATGPVATATSTSGVPVAVWVVVAVLVLAGFGLWLSARRRKQVE